MDYLLLVVGIALLYAGGEVLVSDASALARRLGMSPLVVGLTVVAFGTSSPELATTMAATLQGSPDVAFGNVVGSNIANLGLVLGAAALIYPLATRSVFLRREIPFMLASSLALFAVVVDGRVTRPEGLAMLLGLAAYLGYLLHTERRRPEVEKEYDKTMGIADKPLWRSLVGVVVGLAVLSLGARALVLGAVNLALSFGVTERVVGLTVVAFGTSLPELAASVVAARRRWTDIILGNLIGSNIFNILFILGATSAVAPLELRMQGVWTDLLVMLGISLLIGPFLRTGMRISRWEGAVLVAVYFGYVVSLFAR